MSAKEVLSDLTDRHKILFNQLIRTSKFMAKHKDSRAEKWGGGTVSSNFELYYNQVSPHY